MDKQQVSAREIYRGLGYARWDNFHNLIRRVSQLIDNGHMVGVIRKTTSQAGIGSGAVRIVEDYLLDRDAFLAMSSAATSYKTSHHFPRNEVSVLSLLNKWCSIHSHSFVHQYRYSGFVYDGCINDKILIEFDEPHHEAKRQSLIDCKKTMAATAGGKRLLRFTLEQDIIDVLHSVQHSIAHG